VDAQILQETLLNSCLRTSWVVLLLLLLLLLAVTMH
jgi:hypothetical protein